MQVEISYAAGNSEHQGHHPSNRAQAGSLWLHVEHTHGWERPSTCRTYSGHRTASDPPEAWSNAVVRREPASATAPASDQQPQRANVTFNLVSKSLLVAYRIEEVNNDRGLPGSVLQLGYAPSPPFTNLAKQEDLVC